MRSASASEQHAAEHHAAEHRASEPSASERRPRRHQPVAGPSLRTRLLALLLGLTTVSVLTVGYLGVRSIQTVGDRAQRISADALKSQAEEYLRQVTVGDAQKHDLILESVQHDAENMAQYTARLFDTPDAFANSTYWRALDHMFTGSDGQYMNGASDVSDVFVPAHVDIDGRVLAVLDLSAYLDFILVPTYESDPGTVALYLGTEEEILRYYPNINIGDVVPPDFQVTQRPWYLSAAPESNPERRVVWSPVYVDATGQGLMVTAAAPVYTGQEEFIGVVGIDFTLKNISDKVASTRLLGSGYSFLVDNSGHAIALPERGFREVVGRPPEPDELGVDLRGVTTEFGPVLAKMIAGSTGFEILELGGKELYVAYAPLESAGWSLANIIEAETVLQAVDAMQGELEASARSLVLARILPAGGAILIAMAMIGLVLANRMVRPIREMATAAQRIGAGEWDAPLPRTGQDEVGVLARAFATMTAQLRESLRDLEQRIAERTRDLERRSIQLETAAQVAREAAAIRDVSQLLDKAVLLISDRFGFYHTGLFILDTVGKYALLQAASSEGGKRMLARGHKLRVGEVGDRSVPAGIVGYVAGTGEPRIALDVGEDAVFFDNPDLPETRSEMALPLKVRNQVIGVLDVQSKEPAAFSDEDVGILQTLADQLALAIDNARLLEEIQDRLREFNALLGQHSREDWERLLVERPNWGFTYDGVKVMPREEAHVVQDGHQLAVPIQARGEVIGHVDVVLAGRPPTPEEEAMVRAVVEQASLALDNARLYQDTQRRAARERLIGEITARVRASLDLETVLRTAADEMYRSLGLEEIVVRMAGDETDGDLA
jgi:GAF domain-containing protein